MQTQKVRTSLIFILASVFATDLLQSILAQEQPKPKARISGRVFSAAGKPLARVMIEAMGQQGSGGGMAYTDESGHYSLEVAPGSYRLQAQRNGYVMAFYKLDDSVAWGTLMTVEAGQNLTGINFRLAKGGVIAGRILDENGEPLVGEQVHIRPKKVERATSMYPRPVHTDDRGAYRLYGLPSGTYYVSVEIRERKMIPSDRGRRYVSGQAQTTYYPGVTSLDEATEVAVTEGAETTGIDFKLKVASLEGTKIFGRIGDPDGKPLAGAYIYARLMDRSPVSFNTSSDADGQYEIEGLASGKYMVRVQPLSREENDSDDDITAPPAQEVMVDTMPVEVNFEFVRGGRVSGQVVLENGRAPKDVTKLTLVLRPVVEKQFDWSTPYPPPRPNSEGVFTIKRIPSGLYRLSVYGIENSYYLKSVVLGNADVRESGIPVESGSETPDVFVVLSDAGATVRGRVVGDKGPLADASVSLVSVDILTGQASRRLAQSGAMTDQRGQFQIKAIRPGRYFIYAYKGSSPVMGKESLADFLRRHQDRLQVVELKANEARAIDLTLIAVNQP